MFFETKHSVAGKEFSVSHGEAITYPMHLHRAFEYFLQILGESEITVDGKTYILRSGDGLLIFPFQVHSYKNIKKGRYEIGFFAPETVAKFHKKTDGRIPTDNLFSFSSGICNYNFSGNVFLQKAHCYRICGEFDEGRTYISRSERICDDIIEALLLFIESNFRTECSLRCAASSIGYDYAYISKYFKAKIGIPYKTYVNMLRIRHRRYLLESTSLGILKIAEESGFGNPRTFNREFIGMVGITPTEYRRSIKRASAKE